MLLLFSGCSGLEKSEKEKLREQNAKGEYIYRMQEEHLYKIDAPTPVTPEPYPWQKETLKN